MKAADEVIVPFKPDYVSQLAVDRIALLIEEKRTADDLAEVPLSRRRYRCLANGVRDTGRDRLMIEEIGLLHPMMASEMPQSEAIANAFDWDSSPKSIEEKYGAGTAALRKLYDEIAPRLEERQAA